jgi:hypothetical protein
MSGIVSTLRRAASDPRMRRLQLASAGWSAGEAAYLVGVFVYAYDVGGAALVATIAIVRTLPSVLLAPTMAAVAADRSIDGLLRWTLAVRLVAVGLLAAATLVSGPFVLIAALVAVDSVAATFLRPLRGAALPSVARSPAELVTGNVALTTGDSLANLVGPGIAAVALLLGGTAAVFVPALALLVGAFLCTVGLRLAPVRRVPTSSTTARTAAAATPTPAAASVRPGWSSGLRWLARSDARWVVALFVVQRLVRGALTVLLVSAAIDLLAMGDAGVGILTAALGVGGILGSAVAVTLVGRERLAPAFAAGVVVWSLPLAVIGLVPLEIVALTVLAIGGVGKVLIDVAGSTLLQRVVPNPMRTRVLGLQEGLVTAALAAGSILASILIEALGISTALIVAGVTPLVATLVVWPGLRRSDAAVVVPAHEIALLRAIPMFEPLPLATIEELADGLRTTTADADTVLIAEGDHGDRFWIIVEGGAEAQAPGRPATRLGPGDGFGEIALLRDVRRTATVRSVGPVRLAYLERDRFLAAVTGDRASSDAAATVIDRHLGPR